MDDKVRPIDVTTVQERVYQEFTYHHAKTPTRQLLYPKGARVTVDEARRLKASLETDPANR